MINTVSVAIGDFTHCFEVTYTLYEAEPSTDTPETVEIERVWLAGSAVEIKGQLRAEDIRLNSIGMGKYAVIPMIEQKILKGDFYEM